MLCLVVVAEVYQQMVVVVVVAKLYQTLVEEGEE